MEQMAFGKVKYAFTVGSVMGEEVVEEGRRYRRSASQSGPSCCACSQYRVGKVGVDVLYCKAVVRDEESRLGAGGIGIKWGKVG